MGYQAAMKPGGQREEKAEETDEHFQTSSQEGERREGSPDQFVLSHRSSELLFSDAMLQFVHFPDSGSIFQCSGLPEKASK